MNISIEEALEEMGFNPAPNRNNEEWIKALEARLCKQRSELASLLDHAAENDELLPLCRQIRREMEKTKQRLVDCVTLRDWRN